MTAGYDTLIVTFSDPIKVLDNMFSDVDAWGTDTLKDGWRTMKVRGLRK